MTSKARPPRCRTGPLSRQAKDYLPNSTGSVYRSRPHLLGGKSESAIRNRGSARESWIPINKVTRPVVANPIPGLRRDLGESK
jgi:hypothetical protein